MLRRVTFQTLKIGAVTAFVAVVAVVMSGVAAPSNADAANVRVYVDRGSQTMRVYVGGALQYRWRVSTGRRGYTTPSGTYRPKWLARMHYSRKYHNSPMPFSIFYSGGYAIHGTNYVRNLGRRASHGCVRLAPSNAARLFRLVQRHGKARTRISIR